MDYALNRLSFNKATGWDFIPGMVFKMIMDETKLKPLERREFLDNLAKVCNQMMREDTLPEEIFSTRLICFNKNALCLVDIDAIRPIGVNGVISKIMEIVVRRRLRQHI